jgi:drug/metabolite transporter (DMT)-like permease
LGSIERTAERLTPKPHTLKAIALIVTAMSVLPLIDVCGKFLGQQGVPVFQMVWGRFFFGALFTLPFALKVAGKVALRPSHPLLQSSRAGLLILGTACFFWSLKYLPIADTLAIYFVQPILITALSPVVLGERVDVRRWMMVLIGFCGVLVIIRPGFQQLNPGVFFALGAGTLSALYILLTRHMTGSVSAVVTTFQTSLIGAIALSLVMPTIWYSVNVQQWLLLIALGFFAILGHYFITKAYTYGEASLLSPLGYTEMITAVLCGWYFFGDFPDLWTFVGVAILMACAIYISVRERANATSRPSMNTL